LSGLFSRIRQPVERRGAERYLRITLLSFAASVVVTRLFLSLTGYPRVGGGSLHIAHLLWGGLLLFVASLLPLILTNRWVYPVGALLSGIGVGLFIDEVGKFITQSNDYFYPAAAPIIYAFFLLTVLLYLRVRRPVAHDPRTELYGALDDLSEVLDHHLEAHERAELQIRLRWVARQTAEPEMSGLARALLEFLDSQAVVVPTEGPTLFERLFQRARTLESRYLGRKRLKAILVGGLGLLGLPAVVAPLSLLQLALDPSYPPDEVARVVTTATLGAGGSSLVLALARLLLSGVAGLPLLAAAALLVLRRDRWGTELAYFGLLISLTALNLLVFYLDQFQAIGGALIQFVLLRGVILYRRHYLVPANAPTRASGLG
jgi:hypothetical protein